MAYIIPDSEVRLLKDIPLSKDYENTIFFADITKQTEYFISKTEYRFTNVTYQRLTPNIIRLEINAEDATMCSYLMFKNTKFGNKWFYAFIDRVDYINNGVAQISFTIDVLQTWHFDYNLTDCFIERMHTKTDYFGDNVHPEPVDTGEMINNDYKPLLTGDILIIIGTVDIKSDVPVDEQVPANIPVIGGVITTTQTQGHRYQGLYSGLTYTVFDPANFKNIDSFLSYYIGRGQADSIVSIYTVPADLFGSINIPSGGLVLSDSPVFTDLDQTITGITTTGENASTLDGYTPVNKKLYTYPYNYFQIDNGSGDKLQLTYERMSDPANIEISIKGNIQQPVSLMLQPKYYNMSGLTTGADIINHEMQLTLSNYPLCSWNVDTYSAWVAQNAINLPNQITGLFGQAFYGFSQGGAVGAAAGAISGGLGMLVNTFLQSERAKRAPDTLKGSSTSGNGAIPEKRQNYFITRKTVTRRQAKIIDDYFTMFGYSYSDLYLISNGDPRVNRPHYTYIKTLGCNIAGSIPADDMASINNIYDKGVRFWSNPEEVGNFSLDNRPV